MNMPSGGARARSGPPPDPNALRRDRDKAEWTHLPAAGRTGDPPAWPLDRIRARERVLWASEWQRPQAVIWEARGQALEVALYVRAVVVSEGPKASAPDRNVVLRHMDDLGISSGGLAKNRWIIDGEAQQQVTRTDDPDHASTKARFRSIAGGVAS
jgi:hypothetical protein